MDTRTIAFIGSTEVPASMRRTLWKLGRWLAQVGSIISTGNGPGSEQLLQAGANTVDPSRVALHLPWRAFEEGAIARGNRVQVVTLARYETAGRIHHPFWGPTDDHPGLTPGGKRLVARAIAAIESADVVVGLPDPRIAGDGHVGFAMSLARCLGTPVIDLVRGRGLELLRGLLRHLPEEDRADLAVELIWLGRRSGGLLWLPETTRLSRDAYREHMERALAHLATFGGGLGLEPMQRLGDYLTEVDGECRIRVLDDPLLDRVLVRGRVEPREWRPEHDPEAPETELSGIFSREDTGNPVQDTLGQIGKIRRGERLWYETCRAVPGGVVLREGPPERRGLDPLLPYLGRIAADFFLKDAVLGSGRARSVSRLRRRALWAIDRKDTALLLELSTVLAELELPVEGRIELLRTTWRRIVARKQALLAIERVVWDVEARARIDAEAARTVLREVVSELEHIWGELAVAVEPPRAEEPIEWDVVAEGIRAELPGSFASTHAYYLEKAKTVWARWCRDGVSDPAGQPHAPLFEEDDGGEDEGDVDIISAETVLGDETEAGDRAGLTVVDPEARLVEEVPAKSWRVSLDGKRTPIPTPPAFGWSAEDAPRPTAWSLVGNHLPWSSEAAWKPSPLVQGLLEDLAKARTAGQVEALRGDVEELRGRPAEVMVVMHRFEIELTKRKEAEKRRVARLLERIGRVRTEKSLDEVLAEIPRDLAGHVRQLLGTVAGTRRRAIRLATETAPAGVATEIGRTKRMLTF